jgi:membrane protease YdiL (CAAX protease family)
VGGYLHWSRDAAVGLFAVLPLWALYEVLRLWLAPEDRNGAEILLLQGLSRLGARGHWLLSGGFCVLLVFAARSLHKRNVPWLRVAAVIVLEGTVYALMLGPIASAMATSAVRVLAIAPVESSLLANLVGSLGAGIFEELVFRLGLMSALVWLGLRASRASALPKWVVGVFAVVASALVFSWFHHLCGQPFDQRVFLYRTMAGILLGFLMWARGYGVCVYTHAIYDVYFYLSSHAA